MREILVGAGAAAIIALGTACGDDTPAQVGQDAGHNEQDVGFAQTMRAHHQQAVDLAELAVDRATALEVKDLASTIGVIHSTDIVRLDKMLGRWGTPSEPAKPAACQAC